MKPQFHQVDLGTCHLWSKATARAAAEQLAAIVSDEANAPISLDIKMVIADGPYKGKPDKTTLLSAVAVMKNGQPSVEFEFKLN